MTAAAIKLYTSVGDLGGARVVVTMPNMLP